MAHSDETRFKMSEAHRARWADPNTIHERERMAQAQRQRWQDPEYRAKVVSGLSGPRRRSPDAIVEEKAAAERRARRERLRAQ